MFKVEIFNKVNTKLKDSSGFTLAIAILLLLLVALLEQRLSILVWGGIWLIIGWVIISISIPVINKNQSLSLYYSFFTFYFLYSAICNYYYVSDPLKDYFYARDSTHFFEYSNMLGSLYSAKDVFHASFTDFMSADWKAFAFISGIVAFFADYLDNNNILVQKLIIVFFSSMILPFLFNIMCNYFERKKAYLFTLIYGLFSYSLFYSAVLIRDTPIGFFFILLIYLFYLKRSLNKIPLFIILSIIIFLFRPEHGIFSLIFLFAYLYIYLRENNSKYKFLFIIPIIILGGIAIGNEMDFFFNTINSTTNRYLEHSVDLANSNSLGLVLLKLPWGLRQLASGLFSQILPFPFYTGLDKNGLGFITLSIAALFWFFIWFVLIQFLFSSNKRKIIDNNLWILLLIASILVLGASVNADTRRIMAVYPIFYIISIKAYSSLSKLKRINITLFTVFSYILLLGVYLFIKG